jgi:hypothetical protein
MKTIKKMILTYLIGIVASLQKLCVGTITMKIKATITLGLMVSPFALIFERTMERFSKWSFDNSNYIIVVLIAIAIDHVLGTAKHLWWDKDFKVSKNIIGLMVKLSLVVACGFLFEALNVIIDKDTIIQEYLTIVTRLIVFIYPAGSAFASSTIMSNGKFPPQSWLDRLKKFQANLDPQEFQPKNQDQNP